MTSADTVKTPPYLLQSPTLKSLCWCNSLRALGQVLSMGSKTGNPWAITPFCLFTLPFKQWLEGEEELMYCCFYPLMGTTLSVIMVSRAPRCLLPWNSEYKLTSWYFGFLPFPRPHFPPFTTGERKSLNKSFSHESCISVSFWRPKLRLWPSLLFSQ